MMYQLMEKQDPLFLKLLIGHPEKELITLEKIEKLSHKFKLNKIE